MKIDESLTKPMGRCGVGFLVALCFVLWGTLSGAEETVPQTLSPQKEEVSGPSVPSKIPSQKESAAVPEAAPKSKVIPKDQEVLNMIRGDIESIKVYSLIRVSVSDPDVADIASVESDQVSMLAKQPGQTSLFLWDQYGKRTILIRVSDENLTALKNRLEKLLKGAGLGKGLTLEASEAEGKVVISGELPADKREKLDVVINPFQLSVLNLVQEELMEDLVQVDVEIAEVSASLSKTLGIDWTSALTYKEEAGTFVSEVERDIFKVGPLSRTTQILATVRALITEGKGRVLSKPKLVVVSGKEASFLVGGEIPITTTTTSAGGNVTQNVQFKNFGVSLTITPTIKKNDRVDVMMSIEVSDVDKANAVGENVAFSTRTAQTQLLLDDGQTVVLAGLIKHNEGETVSKVPFLGDIPLLGAAFRWRRNPTANTDTELVITLTPTILRQKKAQEQETASKEGESPFPEEISSKISPKATGMDSSLPSASIAPKENPPQKQADLASGPSDLASEESAEDQDELIGAYVRSLQERIAKAIAYPFEATGKGWEGTVKLTLHLLKDGSLADTKVKESSGYTIFDKDALNTVKLLAPYQPFPSKLDLAELMVTAPIVYSQKAFSKDLALPTNLQRNRPAGPTPERYRAGGPLIPDGAAYSDLVQKRIAGAIVYPEEARQYGWEGTVKLALHILSDGTLAYAAVKESSGYDLFDESALQTAQKLAPYSNFPPGADLQELNVTVPIVYSLEKK